MPVARRTNRSTLTDEERAQIRFDVLSEVQDALNNSSDYDEFRDAMVPEGPQPLTVEDVKNMSADEINSAWPAVQAAMEASGAAPPPPTTDPPPPGRRATGQQLVSEGNPGPEPLSFEVLRRLSPEEHISRRSEIDKFLGGEAA
jgi:hypothetical protein